MSIFQPTLQKILECDGVPVDATEFFNEIKESFEGKNYYNVETVERRGSSFHYMRVSVFNSWGEIICKWRFKKWK